MKKLWALFLAIFLLTVCIMPASAATHEGKCGDNLYWKADTSTNTLTISGTGDMYDYSPENPAPWAEFSRLYYCTIEKGVTGIGSWALSGSSNFTGIWISETVDRIGAYAFGKNTSGALHFYGAVPSQMDRNALTGRTGTLSYLYGWTEADLEKYAGHLSIYHNTAVLQPETKFLYKQGEKILPEDFVLNAFNTDFSPAYVQMGYYDTSTTGPKKVKVTLSGLTFEHQYYVTDGSCHMDDVRVQPIDPQPYTSRNITVKPTVKLGGVTLTENLHYTLSYANNIMVGADASVTVTGIGELEGYTYSQDFAITRRDISSIRSGDISVGYQGFQGIPLLPEPKIYVVNRYLTPGVDFDVTYENHVNIGTATMRIVAKGNYYGTVEKTFDIKTAKTLGSHTLEGAYLGQADGELSDQIYYSEKVVTPGKFTAQINATVNHYTKKHVAYYELYRLDGEEMTLVTSYQSEYGYKDTTQFTYDFTDVYEGSVETGGEVYLLSYSWVNSDYGVYAGAMALFVPAKVPDGTDIGIDVLPDTDDFRKTYFYAYSMDGNLGNITWSSSDPSVATMKKGVLTALKPGTVTVTGSYGALSATYELTIPSRDLSDINIYYNEQTGKVHVYYHNIPLTENTDYTCTTVKGNNQVTVTVTGCGLFTGDLTQSFDILPPVAAPQSATFKSVSRAKTLLLKDITYMRATVAFMDGNGGNASISKADILKNGRILFWREQDKPASGQATIQNATVVQRLTDAGVYTDGILEYSACSHGIAPKEYRDDIYYCTYIVVNGVEYYGEMNRYSVVTYADNQLRKNNTELKNLLAAMLNYGTAAQHQFNYRTDRLSNAGLQAWVDQGQLDASALILNWDSSLLNIPPDPTATVLDDLRPSGAKRTAASLILEGLIQPKLTFAYNITNGKGTQLPEGGSVTVYYWSQEDYADMERMGFPMTRDNATYELSGDQIRQVYSSDYGYEYVVVLDGFAPKQLGNALYTAAVFTMPDGTEYCSGVSVYSPEVYANNQLNKSTTTNNLKTLLKWMVIYGERAKNYFAK